jgi:hypothetical protein
VKWALAHGADPDAVTDQRLSMNGDRAFEGYSALQVAVANCDLWAAGTDRFTVCKRLVEMLLASGASPRPGARGGALFTAAGMWTEPKLREEFDAAPGARRRSSDTDDEQRNNLPRAVRNSQRRQIQ